MLPDLREKIEEAAKASGRSMNAEIVARLNKSFTLPDLGGKTTSIDKHGHLVQRDIVQHIADLQELLGQANLLANSLSLFEGVRDELNRRDSNRIVD